MWPPVPPPVNIVLVDPHGGNTYLRTRSQFEMIDAVKKLFKVWITRLTIEVSPERVTVQVHSDKDGYQIDFVSLGSNVSIEPVLTSEGQMFPIPKEHVTQRYIPAALELLKSFFDDLEVETEIDQLEVIVDDCDSLDFQYDKNLFFTTLQYHFHYMNKKLNVGHFVMKYNGALEDEEDVLTFFRNMNLIGDKLLTFESSNPDGSELCLDLTLELDQWWDDVRTLIVKWPMWTCIPADNWMHFTDSEIWLWHLDLETVEKVIQNAHSTPNFQRCTIRIHTEDWKDEVHSYIESHFNNAYENEYINFDTIFQVFMGKDTCMFASTPGKGDPLDWLNDLHKLSIDLNPERACLKASNEYLEIENTFIPVHDTDCRVIRKVLDSNLETSYEHKMYNRIDYISKFFEKFRTVLDRLKTDAIVDELHVALGWKKVDAKKFKTQRDSFVEMMRKAFGSREKCVKVNKLVIEYSGAGADEDIVMAILPGIELTGDKELHFRPHPLDDQEKPFKLTDQEEKGVLGLVEWSQVKKFVMYAPFYSQIPMDTLLKIPESKIVIKWITMVHVLHILRFIRTSETFISCEIETLEANQNMEIFRFIRGSFEHKNETETEFRDLKGLEVLLDKNVYIFKAPPKELI